MEAKSTPAEEVPGVHEDEDDAMQMDTVATPAEISKPLPASDKEAPWKPFDRAGIAAAATRARMAELMPPPRGSPSMRREGRGEYLSSSNDASASESEDTNGSLG
jgi:hypothetical protein